MSLGLKALLFALYRLPNNFEQCNKKWGGTIVQKPSLNTLGKFMWLLLCREGVQKLAAFMR